MWSIVQVLQRSRVYSYGPSKGFSLLMTLVTVLVSIVTLRILMQNIKFAIRINLDYDLDA